MNNTADYKIYVAGKLLDPEYNLKSLHFEESLTETGKFEFEIYYSDYLPMTVEQFKINTEVKLQLGYNGDLQDMFTGYVYEVTPTFPDSESPYIKIVCYDVSSKLKDSKKTKLLNEDTPRGAVKRILDDYKGIGYVADMPMLGSQFMLPPDHVLYQEDRTDWDMLSSIAELGGYWAFVYNGIIYIAGERYVLSNLQDEEFLMVYRPDEEYVGRVINKKIIPLKNFAPTVSREMISDRIEKPIWKSVGSEAEEWIYIRQLNTGKFDVSKIKPRDLMFTYDTIAVPDRTHVKIVPISGRDAIDLGQSIQVGTEIIKARRRDTVTGAGAITGEPALRIGQKHHFLLRAMGEFGEQYSGHYLVTETKHEISDNGYVTSFKVSNYKVVLLEE